MTNELRWVAVPLAVFSILYLVVLFPSAYFRHDDWFLLGNSVIRVPQDWGFVWRTALYMMDEEVAHFFRPLVKLAVLAEYHVFHFNYYAYLCLHLVLTLGALYYGYQCVLILTRSHFKASVFISFFAACLHLHVGSIVWLGEGILNCPQVFLLAFSCYAFLKNGSKTSLSLSIMAFIASLGFKESSVFFLAFLWATISYRKSWSRDWQRFAVFACISVVYLYVRLFKMPMNPSYKPTWELVHFVKPIFYLFGALLGPVLIFCIPQLKYLRLWPVNKTVLKQVSFFLPFFAVASAPYIGHEFFSPGWLLLPGFFLAMTFALFVSDSELAKKGHFFPIALVFILSSAGVVFQMNRVSWWQWKDAQRSAVQAIRDHAGDGVDRVAIFNCGNPEKPFATMERVVGSRDHLFHMREMLHGGKSIPVDILYCNSAPELKPRTAYFRFKFPHMELVGG